jgi:hypothetical protein
VTPEVGLVEPLPAAGAEILSPPSGTVLTSTEPISVTGDVYADNGLRVLRVLNNEQTVFFLNWDTPGITNTQWTFTWTPPGEGVYRFLPLIDDWTGVPFPESSDTPAGEDAVLDPDGANTSDLAEDMTQQGFLPWVGGRIQRTDGRQIYLPALTNSGPPLTDVYTGTVATYYVDLTPPEISIEPTVLTSEHALGPLAVELSGTANDGTLVHRVDVRIGDGPWQRAGLDDAGGWRFPWRLFLPPVGESYEVSARATDMAGRTTVVTETVVVDFTQPSQAGR